MDKYYIILYSNRNVTIEQKKVFISKLKVFYHDCFNFTLAWNVNPSSVYIT